jgi:predicted DNA binding protein/PAS domain-containing protein
LLRLVSASEYLYLDQTVLIVVGILAPLVGNAMGVFELTPIPGLDPTPVGFSVLGLAFGNALFRYRLFELLPATRRLGRQAALVGLDDGVVIVDPDRTILYCNPAAADILDCEPGDAMGESIETLVDTDRLDFEGTDRLAELTRDGRTYEVETAPIDDRRGTQVGHTILLYDVTERTRREQELRTQRDRYKRLERINTVIREVNQALVSATTVADLQTAVVETLATPGLYDDVWLTTTATDGPPVRMRAGDDEPSPADADALPPGLESPSEIDRADVAIDTDGGPDDADVATDGGDWTTVPIVYGRTVYGALALHTDRESGFDERERDVLDELGETIGHALTAIERTHLLVADTHVELDLQSSDEDALLVALAAATDCEWTLEGLVPAREGDLLAYLSTDADLTDAGSGDAGTDGADADGDDPDVPVAETGEAAVSAVEAARGHAGVSEVRRIEADGGTTMEVRASEGLLAHPLMESGANVGTATASNGRCRLEVELSPDANVRVVLDRVRDEFPDTELLAKRDVEPTDGDALPDEADLTDRQREALEAAFRAGYFEWPRDSTAEEVAESLDITSPTLHSHLRKAEGQLVEEFFES